jgi:hypothetical protein
VDQPTYKRPRPVGNRRKTVKDLPAEYSSDLSEKVKWDVVAVCRHELRKMKKQGAWDGDPESWHPAKYLTRVVEDETIHHPVRVVAAKELMPYFGIDKATLARIEAGLGDSGAHITVHIEGYAASKSAPAIETPKPAIDVVARDPEVATHRNSPATPDVSTPKYREFEVIDGDAVAFTAAPVHTTDDDPVVITDGVGNTYKITRRI